MDWLSILQIILLFIVPVLLFILKIIPMKYRIVFLTIITLLTLLIVFFEKWSFQKLGIRFDNFKSALLPYGVFVLIGVVGIIIVALIMGKTTIPHWWQLSHLQYGFLILAIFQEFLYRGYLIVKLQEIFINPVWIILINAILFSFLHIIYGDWSIVVPITFIGGLTFAGIYFYYPNLILVTISHAIFNFVTVLFGFFKV